MSVIIDMDMPRKCIRCPLCLRGVCLVDEHDVSAAARDAVKDQNCPLVQLPPHGDLKDRDAFAARVEDIYCKTCERRMGMKRGKRCAVYEIGGAVCKSCGVMDALDDLADAPVVVPGEVDKDGRD